MIEESIRRAELRVTAVGPAISLVAAALFGEAAGLG